MLKLGIIGTNWITQQFIDAAAASGEWQLTSVYSRHAETAQAFAAKNHADETFTDLDAFSVGVVLIRSTLHHQTVCILPRLNKQSPMVSTSSSRSQPWRTNKNLNS